jgi:hypothetical protein
MQNSIQEKAAAYVAARRERDMAETLAKEKRETCEQAEADLVVAMTDAEIASFKNEEGVHFIMQRKVRWNCPADKREEAFIGLRAIGLGDIIQETVNAQTLTASINELIDRSETGTLPPELEGSLTSYETTEAKWKEGQPARDVLAQENNHVKNLLAEGGEQ